MMNSVSTMIPSFLMKYRMVYSYFGRLLITGRAGGMPPGRVFALAQGRRKVIFHLTANGCPREGRGLRGRLYPV
jgi:hypothetical protein